VLKHTHTHTHARTHMQAHAHTDTRAHTHTSTHTHTHTRTHTDTRTQTHARAVRRTTYTAAAALSTACNHQRETQSAANHRQSVFSTNEGMPQYKVLSFPAGCKSSSRKRALICTYQSLSALCVLHSVQTKSYCPDHPSIGHPHIHRTQCQHDFGTLSNQ